MLGTKININTLHSSNIFLVDQVEVDLSRNLLSGPNGEVRLEPRVIEILGQLAAGKGQVVLREQMLDKHGSDEGITRAISILRKTFKKISSDQQYIETIPKKGYRLLVSVTEKNDPVGLASPVSQDTQMTTLAVLAFIDLSEKQDQEFLSDGISEEIINALVRLPFLQVTGRTSSFSFKGTNKNVRDIAKTLNVSHVLEGSLRKHGDRLRITVQLIEAQSDRHLWSENFDGTSDDIFELQENIARAVEQKLRVMLSVESAPIPNSTRLTENLTNNKEAYNQFLLGRHLMYELSGQRTIPRAVAAFEKAVKLDPDFVKAWAHLAIANFTLPEYSTTPFWADHFERARAQTAHALSLNPKIAWTQRARAGLLTYDLKIDEAVEAYKLALELEPNEPELMFTYGYILAAIGLSKKAGVLMQDAMEREPLLGPWHAALGTVKFSDGMIDDAEAQFKTAFDCNFGYGAILYAQLLVHKGKADQAVQFLNENFDDLGVVLQTQLKSTFVRKLTYAAFLRKSKIARVITDLIMTKRMNNPANQPTIGGVIGFIQIGRPEKFMQHILTKPNPYVGFTLSRMWEPTDEARSILLHEDFPKFAESIGLVKAWQKHGWPDNIQPIEGTNGGNLQFICS